MEARSCKALPGPLSSVVELGEVITGELNALIPSNVLAAEGSQDLSKVPFYAATM
jgi:hypothetical protein